MGGFRRSRYREVERTGLSAYLVATAYNLVRMGSPSVLFPYGRLHHPMGRFTLMGVALGYIELENSDSNTLARNLSTPSW